MNANNPDGTLIIDFNIDYPTLRIAVTIVRNEISQK